MLLLGNDWKFCGHRENRMSDDDGDKLWRENARIDVPNI